MYIVCTKHYNFFLVLGTVAINCGFSANLAENPQVKATGIGNYPNFLDLPETTLYPIGRNSEGMYLVGVYFLKTIPFMYYI